MNKFYLLIILCFLSISTAFAAGNLNVSFLQTAEHVTLVPINKKQGLYKLTLQQVRPYVTYYSDRPNRVIGQISNKKFYAKWQEGKNSFSKDSPNAVLSGIQDIYHQVQAVNVVMSLSNPVYDSASKSISYEAHILTTGQSSHVMSFYYVTLFIDNACLTCVG
jgi:hypothetical protein